MATPILKPAVHHGCYPQPLQRPSGPSDLKSQNSQFKPYKSTQASPEIIRSGLIPHVTSGLRIHRSDHPPRNRFTPAPARSRFIVQFPILGKGSYGTVYRVKDALQNKRLALKVFHPHEFDAGKEEVANQESWKGIPHVLPIETSFCQGKVVGIVMKESLETLHQRIYRDPLTLPHTVSAVLRNYLRVYQASSARGLVHGDHKPDNCFIEPAFAVSDFGSSHLLTHRKSAIVSPMHYSAPELYLKDHPNYDCSIDLWNIGCIGYEAFMGKRLFEPPADKSLQTYLQTVIWRNGNFPENYYKKGFTGDPQLKQRLIYPDHWSHDIRKKCTDQGVSSVAMSLFMELLRGMLRYENRITAEEGLALCDQILKP